MPREGIPTRRRVVAGYALLAMMAIAALVGTAELLGHDHPAAGPVTPEVAGGPDTLREAVECALPAPREGQAQVAVTADPTAPTVVSSNELYDCSTTWDGRRVRYVGEVVGAVLDRGDHAWTQLNDDVYADGVGPLPTHRDFRGGNAGVGARLTAADADRITTIGGPTRRGDLVEVVATFRRVDPVSDEVAVLIVESLTVVRPGEPFETPPSPGRAVVAMIAALGAVGVVVVERRGRER